MSNTGFNDETLRFGLINATGKELKKVSIDTGERVNRQLQSIDSSTRSFGLLKNELETVGTAINDINSTFRLVANDVETNDKRLQDVCNSMVVLENNVKSINNLVRTINIIADQTNLLALNATIEAARAGENGKGFAVVAHEVKELARTTKIANEDIQKILGSIINSISGLSESILTIKDTISKSLDNVNLSRGNIDLIVNRSHQLTGAVQRNIMEFQDLSNGSKKVEDQVKELSEIGDTFNFLLEMMTVKGLFTNSENPIDRLKPFVEASTFNEPSRFTKFEQEIVLKPDDILISATDSRGVITFANSKFYEIAGYTEGDLLGKPHNIIRHPDMPKTAFKDLWEVLKGGNLWCGIVKNRAKNGGIYWVKAMVFPCFKNNVIVGYLSVRQKPSEREIRDAIDAYRRLP